jgi:endonuclease/exonuclease/phosphatase family metal-dependent hydrolase
LSRFPIRAVDVHDPTEIRRRGGNGIAVRYVLDAPGGPLTVVLVHLQTVRSGLDQILERGPKGGAALAANSAIRAEESAALRRWIDERPAVRGTLVLGDFNMPVESAVYRRSWSDLGNAFSRAGAGLGWTKRTRWHGVRIDHVLCSVELHASGARIAEDVGSDHRPLVARLYR